MAMWTRIPIEETTSATSGARRRNATGAHTTTTVMQARTLGARKPSTRTPSSRMSWAKTVAMPRTVKSSGEHPVDDDAG